MPAKTLDAETDQSDGKLSRRLIVLLSYLPTERVHGVTPFSEPLPSGLPSPVLPKMHTRFRGGNAG